MVIFPPSPACTVQMLPYVAPWENHFLHLKTQHFMDPVRIQVAEDISISWAIHWYHHQSKRYPLPPACKYCMDKANVPTL